MNNQTNVRFLYSWLLWLGMFLFAGNSTAQDDPFELEPYPFINNAINQLVIDESQESYQLLFDKLTNIGLKGEGKVRIVHIGDSHLQADFFSGFFRKRLQTFFLGAMGGRGFIFPYKVAETNNPVNYSVSSKGAWERCRNVEKNRSCELGLSGISVKTTNPNASISVKISDPALAGYDFDRLMVFHSFSDDSFSLELDQQEKILRKQSFPDKGYTLFEFSDNLESVTLRLNKASDLQQQFTLYGLNFDSNDSGIIYHTIGVNGAQYESFLKCEYFIPQLSALNPDWILISLGTNDCYTNEFDTGAFGQKVDSFLMNVQKAAPKAAILLTTPGDHQIKKGPINGNVEKAGTILKERAKNFHLSYWDFFEIMGGANSIEAWKHAGMAHTDYLHFTQKGYEYQAKLLFSAFLKSYDAHIAEELKK